MKDEKLDELCKAMRKLDWSDDKVPRIMSGFFNNPLEAIDIDRCSEEHLEDLYEWVGEK